MCKLIDIYSLSPTSGGLEGGTVLTITGSDFSMDQYFGGNEVYIGGYKCEVITYYTTTERIVCTTPPFKIPGKQLIRVIVDRKVYPTCISNDACLFEYKTSKI